MADEILWLITWMGVLFTAVGIICMLIIDNRQQDFFLSKLVEFGKALENLKKYEDGEMIILNGKICIQTSSAGIATGMIVSPDALIEKDHIT